MHVQAHICECRCLWSPEEDIRALGAIVIDSCDLSEVGAGN